MPKRSRKPRDLNQMASRIVGDATEQTPIAQTESPGADKDPAAVALGRKGGLKGGKARAAKLSPKERSELARHAARVRWQSSPKQ